MNDLDIPEYLRIPQEERRAAWRGVKLTKPRKFAAARREEDAATKAFRREMEHKAEVKKQEALARLRANYKSKPRRKKRR